MTRKVTIELTSEQRKQVKDETGVDLRSLEFDALEDRDAPKGQKIRPDMPVSDPRG